MINRDAEQLAVRADIRAEIEQAERAHDFAAAWYELRAAFPDIDLVRLTLRRKRGQWLVTIGRYNATGSTEADALRAAASMLARSKIVTP